MTISQIVKEALEKMDDIAKTYKALEMSGHLERGRVSEVINWDEIGSHITSLIKRIIEGEIERLKGEFREQEQTENMEQDWYENGGWNSSIRSQIVYLVSQLKELDDARYSQIIRFTSQLKELDK